MAQRHQTLDTPASNKKMTAANTARATAGEQIKVIPFFFIEFTSVNIFVYIFPNCISPFLSFFIHLIIRKIESDFEVFLIVPIFVRLSQNICFSVLQNCRL